jgi:hypothetical protein
VRYGALASSITVSRNKSEGYFTLTKLPEPRGHGLTVVVYSPPQFACRTGYFMLTAGESKLYSLPLDEIGTNVNPRDSVVVAIDRIFPMYELRRFI